MSNPTSHHLSGISIRPAKPADAAPIVRLIHQMGPGSDLTEDYVLQYLSGTERGILLACLGDLVAGLLTPPSRA